MAETFQVPTNGFAVPPAGGAPAAPAPSAPVGVPPAPGAHVSGNGQPIQMLPPGVQPNPAPFAQPSPQAQPQAPAQAALPTVDLAALQALIQGTQPQAAATPAAPAEGSNLPEWAGESLHSFDTASISDPQTKMLAQTLQTLGKDVDLNRALGAALTHSNPDLVDVAYLAEKGGANAQAIAQLGKTLVQAVAAQAEAQTQKVYALVGGEQQWNVAVAAFNATADLGMRQAVAKMMNSGDTSMIDYGAAVIAQYARGGAVPQPHQGVGALAGGGVALQGLSKAEFQAELQKLNPRAQGYDEAYNALANRRAAGKASGL